ncbi:MAG TPA: phage holin family protein [Gemmatimonadales bacterium]|nr:phage holin family protein [Gemmatimonadales bacterium]
MRTLLRFALNTLALYVAVRLVPEIRFDGGVGQFLLVGLVFGAVNTLLRPLLTILTCPLVVLTLGLFTLVINALMLLATGWLSARWDLGFSVDGFVAALLGGIVVSIASTLLALVLGNEAKR